MYGQLRKRRSDLRVTPINRVHIAESSRTRRVSEPAHQILQRRTSRRRQSLTRVTEIVEGELIQTNPLPSPHERLTNGAPTQI